MESKYFLKKINSKLLTIIGIILIIVSIIFEVLVVNDYNEEKKGVKHYEEAQNSDEYVYIDVEDFTDYFATYTSDDSTQYYYFLADEKYLYIGKLKTTDYIKLPGRIYGYTTFIPKDLEDIAIESYNELMEEEIVNGENVNKVFGYYYIDTYRTPSGTLIGFTIPLGIAFIIGIIMVIYDLVNKSKTKKELNKNNLSEIIKDIDSHTTISSHTGKLYLTENYILSYKSKLIKINYSDIVWIYPHTEKYRGITNASIMVMDRNGKIHSTGYMNLTPKTSPEYNELYDSLLNKVPNALHGYTAENKQKAKEEVNKYKIK